MLSSVGDAFILPIAEDILRRRGLLRESADTIGALFERFIEAVMRLDRDSSNRRDRAFERSLSDCIWSGLVVPGTPLLNIANWSSSYADAESLVVLTLVMLLKL